MSGKRVVMITKSIYTKVEWEIIYLKIFNGFYRQPKSFINQHSFQGRIENH